MKRRGSSRIRLVCSTVLGIAVAGAALAQQSSSSPVRESASAAPPTTVAESVVPGRAPASPVVVPQHIQDIRRAMSGMLVAIDPKTGTLRAPEAAEVEALTGAAANAKFAAPQSISLPGGGTVIRTSPASVDLLSATKRADGTIAFTCTHGIDGASRTFAADHLELSKGVRDDR